MISYNDWSIFISLELLKATVSVLSRSFSLGYDFIPDTLGSVTIQVFLVKQA